ncbi:dynamin family protein [uncultured Thiodictyon sp.]|uniref:dynamin family protein n=1 Tax=uncultured Thiodictyon sp. TaxID=1846217 RepID=UPI0025F25212|nr:dynamin family protein [uncultured Thiodictyon sp.]
MPTEEVVSQRLRNLERHLEQENPVLLSSIQSFRELDRVAHGMGLMPASESYATQIPWWPLIAVLGTFSSGKSTFINHFLGQKVQRTGNQAVDDRFTVICYSRAATPHALPGVALDADPRFPLYRISNSINEVASGEGGRIDAYLQLQGCPSEALRGKILIDSPGFDADKQRTATLRIVDHIIDLSDLVLVFFDARHPEPGAMRDTLHHLVGKTMNRIDPGKFMFILNQIDMTAREDNPEDVVAAWQRALSDEGLTAGRFYTIYSPDAASPIEDEAKRRRYEAKRDADLKEIHGRMHSVEVERAYRIVGALDKTATAIGKGAAALLTQALGRWRQRVLLMDVAAFALAIAIFLLWGINAGHWQGLSYNPPWWDAFAQSSWAPPALTVLLTLLAVAVHFGVRHLAAKGLLGWVRGRAAESNLAGDLVGAFQRNTRPVRPMLLTTPAGWGNDAQRQVELVLQNCDIYIQTLNDRFTNPSGVESPDGPEA